MNRPLRQARRKAGGFCSPLFCGVVCWIFGAAGGLPARAAETGSFAQGNARYAAGDYPGAAKAYEEQVRQGGFSANLFYDLGNAYYRAGEKGRAVLNYRRALLVEPGHVEAAANLTFVGGKAANEPDSGTNPRWEAAAWATAVCGWLGAAGWLVMAASRRRRSLGAAMAASGSLLCAVGVGLIWFFEGDRGNGARAVVVVEATPALYSPVTGAKVVTNLTAGGEVSVLSEQGAWTYVRLGDGRTLAWLPSRTVEHLVPR